jgi:hypothetical protein
MLTLIVPFISHGDNDFNGWHWPTMLFMIFNMPMAAWSEPEIEYRRLWVQLLPSRLVICTSMWSVGRKHSWSTRLGGHCWQMDNHWNLDDIQHAIPRPTCNNVAGNKFFIFSTFSDKTLSPRILTDYNPNAAFDRILCGLSIVTCQWLVLPWQAGFLCTTLQKIWISIWSLVLAVLYIHLYTN